MMYIICLGVYYLLESDDDLEVMFAVVVSTGTDRVDISVIDSSNCSGSSDNCSKNDDVDRGSSSGGG